MKFYGIAPSGTDSDDICPRVVTEEKCKIHFTSKCMVHFRNCNCGSLNLVVLCVQTDCMLQLPPDKFCVCYIQ